MLVCNVIDTKASYLRKALRYIIYEIYKSWLRGVFRVYTTRVQGQSKFTTDKPRAEGERFISGKLPMTEDEGCILCGIHPSRHGSCDIYHGL